MENSFHPLLNNHSLTGTYEGCRSINVTRDYRIVYRQIDPGMFLLIDIGTHSELYE